MYKKGGFTLVEMLFVVVIAASIMMFAVPAYKRVQEKADYNAALGILLDVNNAVNSLKRDLQMLPGADGISFPKETNSQWSFTKNTPRAFTVVNVSSWNQWLVDSYSGSGSGSAEWDSDFWGALFEFGYLKQIPDTRGYSMHIVNGSVPSGIADCGENVPDGLTVSACVLKDGTKNDCYKGARILSDGSVQRIKGADCTE